MMYRIQLARERWLLLGWCIGLLVYFFIIGVSYATVKDHEKGLDALWQELPKPLRDAFGDAPSITTPGGYFEARGTSLLPLVLGGALVAQATRRLSGAEQAGELDLVLSLPVRRSTYFWSHAAVGATHAIAWLAAAAVGAVAGMAAAGVDGGDLPRIAFMLLDVLPFVLAVQASALWVGVALHRRTPGIAILTASLAAVFLMHIVGSLDESLQWLRWLSPYSLWVQGNPFGYDSDVGYLVVCGAFVVVGLFVAAFTWDRKDLMS
ncbi:MAG: beta-exotoxin transport system permease protein [Thermoplasmata archaeon]|jgi:putative exporter of polyketide antibiotics|nr:beta-exotoxin transport system permease protein [Thermoplasmata archaeon]MEA3165680.1 beta-exotoxin transport system permease protein [Thermoplasmata archaeon]